MEFQEKIALLQEMIDQSSRIVFFGGAGVSTESGIPDFRSVDGLYHQHYAYPPETMLSHTFYEKHPEEFFRFYRDKLLNLDAQPNAAHRKLAELERAGKLSAVVTQNIDGLHRAAGCRELFELHGCVHRNYCMDCGRLYDAQFILHSSGIPRCACGGVVKPDVVLYEEPLDEATARGAMRVISEADALIVAGTSLNVYPAAGYLSYFRGRDLVVINRDATPADADAALVIREPVGQVLGELRV